jgi:hypothetical protein
MFIISFDIEGILQIELALTGETFNSAYYSDVSRRQRENVRRFLPELSRQKNWLLHLDNARQTLHFSPGNFWPKTT